MSVTFYDRIQETTVTTGTGTLTLAGAVSGYRSFSVVGNLNLTYYCITDSSGNWEVGQGTYTTSGTTLSRTLVLASSNAGAAVNFGAGTKNVFQPEPATWLNAVPTGSGTNNTLSKWTVTGGPSTLGDSQITDNGSAIVITAATTVAIDSASGVNIANTVAGSNTVSLGNHSAVVTFTTGVSTVGLGQRGYIDGLILSNDGTTPNTTIDVAAGECRDDTNTYLLTLSAITGICQSSGSWTAGTGQNKLDAGARGNSTWYHVFAIRKTADGGTEILFSTSATSPSMPSGYSGKRRIGSFLTNGSGNIIKFWQVADRFTWDVSLADLNVTVANTTRNAVTLTVPTGVKVFPHTAILFRTNGGNGYVIITTIAQTDTAPGGSINDLWQAEGGALAYVAGGSVVRGNIYTDTSAQINWRCSQSGGTTALQLVTAGWTDPRGKDA